MLRSLALASIFLSSAFAGLWPEQLGTYHRQSATPVVVTSDDTALSQENGLIATETADYGAFQVKAERYKDPTGAYAASLEPVNRLKTRVGNYLISCAGKCPLELASLAENALPHVSHSSVPTLGDYLPRTRVPGSERYILGPAGLRDNLPTIPPSAVGFEFGTEAAAADYWGGRNLIRLVIFSYPTPAMARAQSTKFQSLTGADVKRTGSFVAVALLGKESNPKIAENLLSKVNYSGAVSINETPPLELKPQSAAQMLLAIFSLAGLVLGLCLGSGLVVGVFLYAARKRFGYSGADGSLTTLHLHGK